MALLVPDIGERALLDMALSDASPEAQTLELYTAGTPAEAATVATFTVATFTGYVAKSLVRATWAAAATNAGTTTKDYPQQSWSPTSSQTVTGYFVDGATSNDLLWCEDFAAGRALQNGDTLNLDLQIELQ